MNTTSFSKAIMRLNLTLARAESVKGMVSNYQLDELGQEDVDRLIKVKRKMSKLKQKEHKLINRIINNSTHR